jgi:hypothetical protein
MFSAAPTWQLIYFFLYQILLCLFEVADAPNVISVIISP